MVNISLFNLTEKLPEYFPFDCDPSYDTSKEMLIYLGMFLWLGVGLIAHFYILMSILVTKRQLFKDSSFFQIFAVDSVASIVVICVELLFTHLFLFVPPLCPLLSPHFYTPSTLLHLVYITLNHTRFIKSFAQCILVLNRMSCVLWPTKYDKIWKSLTPVACLLITVLPFAGTWNLIISRVVATNQRGGFSLGYQKAVKWASISLFQSIAILLALFFTVTCTTVTLYKLISLPGRIKSAEKSLCITSFFISVTFIMVAGTQMVFVICPTCDPDAYYILQFIAFDTFTVGSAVIMILVNSNLRGSIFQGVKRVSISSTIQVNSL